MKQLKHGLRTDKAKAQRGKTIPWLTVVEWRKSTAMLLKKWEAEYDIVYVFITNKTITNIPAPEYVEWPTDLIVVHKPCLASYYGLTVYQIAALSPDDD